MLRVINAILSLIGLEVEVKVEEVEFNVKIRFKK